MTSWEYMTIQWGPEGRVLINEVERPEPLADSLHTLLSVFGQQGWEAVALAREGHATVVLLKRAAAQGAR